MINALIEVRLYGHAEERAGNSGSVLCNVRTASGSGKSVFCNGIAFNAEVRRALLALNDGDSAVLSGALSPKIWTDKQDATYPALDLAAHALMTAYYVTLKRKAMQGGAANASAYGDGIHDSIP